MVQIAMNNFAIILYFLYIMSKKTCFNKDINIQNSEAQQIINSSLKHSQDQYKASPPLVRP